MQLKRSIELLPREIRTFVKHRYIKARNKLIHWNNKRRTIIRLETRGEKLPHFVISAKYENSVKWALRILTIIGILASVITFKWYLTLSLSIILIIIERVLEIIAFQVISIYVQPIPEWDNDQWLAMVFYKIEEAKHLGMLIQTQDQAIKLYNCILQWNYNEHIDMEDNIKLSFVIEEDNTYATFLYPSHERRSVKLFKEKVEYDMFKRKEMKEHQQILISITFCKAFPYQPNSALKDFEKEYKPNTPFAFGIYYLAKQLPYLAGEKPFRIRYTGQNVRPVGEKPIIKFHAKIVRAGALTRYDYENHYRKLVMER